MKHPREAGYFVFVALVVAWWIAVAIVVICAAAEMSGFGYMGGRTPTW